METALDGSATMFREVCRPSMKETKSLLDIPPFPFLLSMEAVGLETTKQVKGHEGEKHQLVDFH